MTQGTQGIDKIALTTKAFNVAPDHRMRVQPMSYHPNAEEQIEEPLLFNEQRGAKAYYNGIGSVKYQLSINSNGLHVQLNPSKALHPYHLNNSDNDIQQVWDFVRDDIKSEAGIIMAPDNELKLARVDMAENHTMNYDIMQYGVLFNSLRGKHMNNTQYPESSYFSNGSREINFYNKTKEVLFNQKLEIEPRLMRAELRAKVSAPVEAIYKLNSLSTLLNVGGEYRIERHRSTLKNTLFGNGNHASQVEMFVANIDLERAVLDKIINDEGRGAFEQWKGDHGIETLLFMFGGMKNIRDFLMSTGRISEQHCLRLIRKWEKALLRRSNYQTNFEQISLTKLYHEVYHKFAV